MVKKKKEKKVKEIPLIDWSQSILSKWLET
jgi:hypothetical protein